jgi:hypothetical protein
VKWFILVAGLELPAVVALLDCINRPEEHFAGGREDQRSWTKWLVIGVALALIGVGYGIVLGYYFSVVRRNVPG